MSPPPPRLIRGLGKPYPLPVRLRAAGVRRRRRAKPAFQFRDPCLQCLIFLSCKPRHILDRLEFLALDDIEIPQDFFGLTPPERIDLAFDALRCTRGVVHQPSDLVEKPVGGLGHGEFSVRGNHSRQWRREPLGSRPAGCWPVLSGPAFLAIVFRLKSKSSSAP